IHTTDMRVDLYVVVLETKTAQKINQQPLNTLPGFSFSWAGNEKLVYKTVPANRNPMPGKKPVPAGPVIQESLGKQGASRTYQDLIKSPYDEEMFTYLTTAQLMVNDFKTEQALGIPDIYSLVSVSPDNNYILVSTVARPFSYLVPYSGFPQQVYIMSMKGEIVKTLASNPSAEGAPIGFDDVPEYPRNFQWRADVPATIFYVQAVDKGMGKFKSEFRDAAYAINPLSQEPPIELFKTHKRFQGIIWGDKEHAIVYESMFADRKIRMDLYNPTSGKLDSMFERSSNDAYSDIGRPLTRKNEFGKNALIVLKEKEILLHSAGSSPEGDLPLLQSMDLTTGKRTILWHCTPLYFETIIDMIDPVKGTFLTSRESTTETPNYYLRDLKKPAPAGLAL
ncbi:MAG: hypothetical protein ACRC2O_07990, partial [Chitinophagaceae bacterium]